MPSACFATHHRLKARSRGRARLYLRRRSNPKPIGESFDGPRRGEGYQHLFLSPASRRIPRPSDLVARRSRSIRHSLLLSKTAATPSAVFFLAPRCSCQRARFLDLFVNDPSAGSPTETLLRLLRPLESTVCPSSRHQRRKRVAAPSGPVQGAH